MDKSHMKSIVVFIIIAACFALIYSRIFHPLISSIVGISRKANTFGGDYDSARYPGGFPNSVIDNRRDGSERAKMAGHPGMHALSEMKKYANLKQSSGGGGILGVVLPLYAVGIVVYLIYTLSRLFLRKQNKSPKSNLGVEAHDYADVYISETDMKGKVLKKQKELEKLLWKADQEDIGDEEVTLLKKRLIETENQMTRILKAMNTIQKTVISADCYSQIKDVEKIKDDNSYDGISFGENECHNQDKVLRNHYNSRGVDMLGNINLKRRANASQKDL